MITTTLCYIENDSRFLMLYRNRKEKDLNIGKWIGVGGKLEAGESVDECVCREVFEETGLTLTSYTLKGVIKFVSDIYEDEDMFLYYADGFTGELKKDCPEGKLEWIDRNKILELPTWEGDKYFLKELLAGKDQIDMTLSYTGDKLTKCDISTETVNTLKSSKISACHGFSTRTGGISEGIYSTLNLGMNRGDNKERVIENWRRFLRSCDIYDKEFICGAQVHGSTVHIARKEDLRPAYGPGVLIEADGYVTNETHMPLAIFIADCVPLLLEDAEHKVIGAIHCGWRSTVADIIKNAIDQMTKLGAIASHIHAAIGPAIDQCCFEVGVEVIEAVDKLIGTDACNFYYKRGEKYLLDLRGVVRQRLIQLGLQKDNIDIIGPCTMCNPQDFWSHRYTKGERGSQAVAICLKD